MVVENLHVKVVQQVEIHLIAIVTHTHYKGTPLVKYLYLFIDRIGMKPLYLHNPVTAPGKTSFLPLEI